MNYQPGSFAKVRSKDGFATGVVLRIGFNTSRGELVREILHPKPVVMKFERDGLKFVGIMAVFAVIGMTYTIVVQIYGCMSTGK